MLKPLWGKSGLSRSSVSRANKALKEAFNNWRHRDLSLVDIVYFFMDGIYLGVRGNSRGKEAVLVAYGITREGKRVVLHLSLGGKESTDSWKGVLNDLAERGLRRPQLITIDGNPGLLKAIRDIWPEIPWQHCVVHRIRNALARVPKKKQDEVKKNVIERSFKEVKRRTRVVGRFPNETSALVMVFSLLEEERMKWQKVRMRVEDIA